MNYKIHFYVVIVLLFVSINMFSQPQLIFEELQQEIGSEWKIEITKVDSSKSFQPYLGGDYFKAYITLKDNNDSIDLILCYSEDPNYSNEISKKQGSGGCVGPRAPRYYNKSRFYYLFVKPPLCYHQHSDKVWDLLNTHFKK